MTKYFYIICMFLAYSQMTFGNKEIKYPVSEIPDSLKTNTKAVIRNWEQVFEIKSIGKGVESVTYAITILNENGLDYAVFRQSYSQKLQKIHSIKGTIYDFSGEKTEGMTLEKIIDQSAISGYSLYEDRRVKLFKPKTMAYPFTVEYSFVVEYDGLFNLPVWQPLYDYNVSVERSKFTLICPNDLSLRYLEKNIIEKVDIVKNDVVTAYTWKVQNIIALTEQPFSGPFSDFSPTVISAPNEFEIEGYKGNLSSWNDFGKWIGTLNEGRDELSTETRALLIEKVKDCKTDYEKARLIYEYMQHKTRYLNITIGIGGWQPIPAETVDRLGYGDCKALSNYTKSLLQAVGLKSYYTLVMAGNNVAKTNVFFPSNHFNHIILCLPLAKDTLWLECTSHHLPFGYIGRFTDDRDALVATETGGKIIHTRIYTAADNRMERNSILTLDASGNASLSVKAMHNGVLYDDKLPFYLAGTVDKKKMIYDEIRLPGAVLNKFDYQDLRSEVPAIAENLEIDLPRYATLSGARMLISLIPLDRIRDVPKKVNERKSDVLIGRATVACDTVTIVIPEEYMVESLPGEIKTDSPFGTYSLQTFTAEDKVICVRRLEMKKGRHPPSSYDELIGFFKKVAAADNAKISLKKKEG
ncbi:MAG: DUF3857 domain-containing transglutaminase family protein [Bacteroidales bacterium]|nr:DUF3857 domain-containing transglutaminase family protein [Bacteroidales bacterium]